MDLESLNNLPSWQWPDNARSTIHKVLIDPRAKELERLRAAKLAGDLVVMNDDLAEALLGIVRGDKESDKLRGRAAISLGPVLEQASAEQLAGEFEDADAVPISKRTYYEIKNALHDLYANEHTPKEVRRRVLEASVRAPEDWHESAVKAAYTSGDREWTLTAVFAMSWIRGFDKQILEALNSTDSAIHREAVNAAGNWGLDAAWAHVVNLVADPATPRPLLLAAIEAVGNIRPRQAGAVLIDLADSDDEEIAEAADEAMGLAEALAGEARYEEDEGEGEDLDEEQERDDKDEKGEWLN